MRPYGHAETLWLGGFLDFWFRKNTVTGFTVFVILLGNIMWGVGYTAVVDNGTRRFRAGQGRAG
jgi:hypothetical protein